MKTILSLTLACATLAAFTHYATAAPGDLDLSFNPSVNGCVTRLTVQPDGKILIGGRFTEVGGIARHGLARLHSDGKLDATFTPALAVNWLNSFAIQSNGKVLVGGVFTNLNATDTYLERLNADGSLDSGFNPVVEAGPSQPDISSVLVQPDGKIVIGGSFTQVSGVLRDSLARLNPDGTLDDDFKPNVFGVYGMVLQPDGKVLVFYRSVVRLNPDGTTEFTVDADGDVESWALQPDGKILIAGDFYTVAGVPRSGLARLNSDGTVDLDFNPEADYHISDAIAVLRDGKILIGSHVRGGGLVQLFSDGKLNPDFNPRVNNHVWRIAIQTDQRILIADSFTAVNGIARPCLARLVGEPASEVSLGRLRFLSGLPGFDIATVSARTVVVEASTNLVDWTALKSLAVSIEPVRFEDADHASFPRRFYRVSW